MTRYWIAILATSALVVVGVLLYLQHNTTPVDIDQPAVSSQQDNTEGAVINEQIKILEERIHIQGARILEYEERLKQQDIEIVKQSQSIEENQKLQFNTEEAVKNKAVCDQKYRENPDCTFEMYRSKKEYEKQLKKYKEIDEEYEVSHPGLESEHYERNKKKMEPIYEKCQDLINQCG